MSIEVGEYIEEVAEPVTRPEVPFGPYVTAFIADSIATFVLASSALSTNGFEYAILAAGTARIAWIMGRELTEFNKYHLFGN